MYDIRPLGSKEPGQKVHTESIARTIASLAAKWQNRTMEIRKAEPQLPCGRTFAYEHFDTVLPPR